jgi:hypothetical protein
MALPRNNVRLINPLATHSPQSKPGIRVPTFWCSFVTSIVNTDDRHYATDTLENGEAPVKYLSGRAVVMPKKQYGPRHRVNTVQQAALS